MKKYTPINCSFYDLFEQDATMKNVSNIAYKDEANTIHEKTGRIVNLYIHEKVEYMKLADNTIIRLDRIVKFNQTDAPNKC